MSESEKQVKSGVTIRMTRRRMLTAGAASVPMLLTMTGTAPAATFASSAASMINGSMVPGMDGSAGDDNGVDNPLATIFKNFAKSDYEKGGCKARGGAVVWDNNGFILNYGSGGGGSHVTITVKADEHEDTENPGTWVLKTADAFQMVATLRIDGKWVITSTNFPEGFNAPITGDVLTSAPNITADTRVQNVKYEYNPTSLTANAWGAYQDAATYYYRNW